MHLTDKDIAKFQKLYKEKFNIELDYNAAYEKASKLVRQMEIVYQPITKEQAKTFKPKKTDGTTNRK